MVIIYDTPRLKLITPHKEYANSILDYHKRNKEFLEIWEPKRPDDFYTLEYQKAWIKAEQKENLSLYIHTKSQYNYLYFPQEAEGTSSGKTPNDFMQHGIDAKYDTVVNQMLEKLQNKLNE